MRQRLLAILGSIALVTGLAFVLAGPAAASNPCADGSGIACYNIGTLNGNETWVGFNNDSVGSFVLSKTSFTNARDIWLQETSSSCDGVDHCFQAHIKTVDSLRLTAASCTGNGLVDLSTDSDQNGDTWYVWSYDGSNLNYEIVSRYCANGEPPNETGQDMASDEISDHSWGIGQQGGWYYKVNFHTANNPGHPIHPSPVR